MKHANYDYTGDGTLYTNNIVGIISRHAFLDEELPNPFYMYLLQHPNRRNKRMWILERLEGNDTSAIEHDEYSEYNDVPQQAFVCFAEDPEFDYISFEENDYDTYIEWGDSLTMQNIIDTAQENI